MGSPDHNKPDNSSTAAPGHNGNAEHSSETHADQRQVAYESFTLTQQQAINHAVAELRKINSLQWKASPDKPDQSATSLPSPPDRHQRLIARAELAEEMIVGAGFDPDEMSQEEVARLMRAFKWARTNRLDEV